MSPKLHIDLEQGQIHVEDDPELAKKVYEDFKDQLVNRQSAANSPATGSSQSSTSAVKTKESTGGKKRSSSKRKPAAGSEGRIDPDNPSYLDLDLSGLKAFYNQFRPKGHAEKLLIFAVYLIDEMKITEPTTDHFYSCYHFLGEKSPNAFAQAFRDTANRTAYLDYRSATEISLTHKGRNYLQHDMQRAGSE